MLQDGSLEAAAALAALLAAHEAAEGAEWHDDSENLRSDAQNLGLELGGELSAELGAARWRVRLSAEVRAQQSLFEKVC